MNTVIFDVRPLSDALIDFAAAFEGKPATPRISFTTPELMFKTLSGKRWAIIQCMTGAGPLTLRETARRVERDVKAVHNDVQMLLNAGVLSKTDDGKIEFPFDDIHVDFHIKAA